MHLPFHANGKETGSKSFFLEDGCRQRGIVITIAGLRGKKDLRALHLRMKAKPEISKVLREVSRREGRVMSEVLECDGPGVGAEPETRA